MRARLSIVFLLLKLVLFSQGNGTQKIIRIQLINVSNSNSPITQAEIRPLYGGQTIIQGTRAGIFTLKIRNIKPGGEVELQVEKEGYRILGPDPIRFKFYAPENEESKQEINLILVEEYNRAMPGVRSAIENTVDEYNRDIISDLQEMLEENRSNEEELFSLKRLIEQQKGEIGQLRAKLDDLASSLTQAADVISSFRKPFLAIPLYEESLSLCTTRADSSELLNRLGDLYLRTNQNDQARRYFRQALALRRRLSTKNPNTFSLLVAETLNDLGKLYQSELNFAYAMDHFEESLGILGRNLSENNKDYLSDWFDVINNISNTRDSFYVGENYEEAISASELIAFSCDSLRQIDDRISVMAMLEYDGLALEYLYERNFDRALHSSTRCLHMVDGQKGIYAMIGHAHWLLGQREEAYVAWSELKGYTDGTRTNYRNILEEDWAKFIDENVMQEEDIEAARAWLSTWE